MNLFKKIFSKTDNIKVEKTEKPIQVVNPKDPYAASWVDNDIEISDKKINGLIFNKNFRESDINSFLNYTTDQLDFDGGGWQVKGVLNFPGPFYTGETDTCGTGLIEAPNNIIFDEHGMEHVMIQPRTEQELIDLCNAGAVEVFGSYFCDGNDYWTVDLVKEWWNNRNDILNHLKNDELIKTNCNQEKRYRFYLDNFGEIDLRKYCYFLENGTYPTEEIKLPEIN